MSTESFKRWVEGARAGGRSSRVAARYVLHCRVLWANTNGSRASRKRAGLWPSPSLTPGDNFQQGTSPYHRRLGHPICPTSVLPSYRIPVRTSEWLLEDLSCHFDSQSSTTFEPLMII
ncbi:hypothetical protein AB1N83_009867 [Pleurotus pulmonarius]